MKKEYVMTREDYDNIVNFALDNLYAENNPYWKRLDYCTAWTTKVGNYIYLKSYNTIVAFFNIHTGFLFDILRVQYGYTSTSAHHISKFRHMIDVKKTIRIDEVI